MREKLPTSKSLPFHLQWIQTIQNRFTERFVADEVYIRAAPQSTIDLDQAAKDL
jgi:hypothetical protein